MADPAVSVVMKAYNHAGFVGQAIESILSQTFSDFELIIVDDASTDGTADVAARYSDPRIRLHRLERNGGISNAMNTAISLAKGEFIATQNSDDFSLPDRIELQVAYLQAHPEALAIFCQPLQVDETGQEVPGVPQLAAPQLMPDWSGDTWLRHFFFHGNCIAPTGMARRSAYLAAGPYDRRLTNLQDLDMWVRMAMAGELHFLPERLVAFRIWPGQTSAPRRDMQIRSQFEFFRILMRYLDLAPDRAARIFAPDIAPLGISGGCSPRRLIAKLAQSADHPAHRLMALQLLFDLAENETDFRELRDLTGRSNVFGVRLAQELRPFPDAKTDPVANGVCLDVDGRSIHPIISGNSASFEIGAQPASVRLISKLRPPAGQDLRNLGVVVTTFKTIDSSGVVDETDVRGPGFNDGFHHLESNGMQFWRWTDGDALVPERVWKGRVFPLTLVVEGMFFDPDPP